MATIYQLIDLAEKEMKDNKAKQAGFMIGISGVVYTKSLGKNSGIYIEKIDDKWVAWRETHIRGKRNSISYRIIASFKEFDYVLQKAKRYIDYIQKRQNK